MKVPEELWLPIAGYLGYYEVSSLGRVRSLDRLVSCHRIHTRESPGKILCEQISKWGYRTVILAKRGGVKRRRIARLVAQAFLPNPENKPEVNHKDGVKTSDAVPNLEWATKSENACHSRNVLGKMIGETHYGSLLDEDAVRFIRIARKRGLSLRSLANRFGVKIQTISNADKRRTWRHVA